MAVLSNTIRTQLWRDQERIRPRQGETLAALTKADLQAAVDAADDWANSNAASFNTALPSAFKNNATAGQKALLLAVVVLARFDPALVRSILGEVD